MKYLTYFSLPIAVLLLLFFFHPVIGFSSHAQTDTGIASPSDAGPETYETTEIEIKTETETKNETATVAEIKNEFDETGQPETKAVPDTPDESGEIPQPDHAIASPSNACISTLTYYAAPVKITEIEFNKYNINSIHLLMQGDSSASLSLPRLDGTIYFYREGASFAEKDVRYSVSCKTEDFDNNYGEKTGLFFLKASILLEDERYVIAPGISTDIFIPIFLYNPEQPSFLPALDPDLNTYDGMEAFNIIADVHTDLQQIKAMLTNDFPYQRFYIYFENGYYLNVPNAWDLDSIETDIPGIYTAYRRPELPQGVLMEDIPEALCSINIQDSKVFTLSSPTSFGNNIVIKWLYPTSEPSLFRLLYRIGSGDWVVDTDEYFMRIHSDRDGKLSLFLNPWEMDKDIHYQFRLEYDGVYSDILELCVNEDGFYIPNEGDEDGGDRDSQTPPDVIQPPPDISESKDSSNVPDSESHISSGPEKSYTTEYQTQPVPESAAPTDKTFFDAESKPDNNSAYDSTAAVSGHVPKNEILSSPKPSVAVEADTSTATTWSGRRIQQYFKASPGLPLIFEKDLILVAIPADSPALSHLSDSDFLHMEIQAMSADTMSLTASLNDVPLTGVPLSITMPWTEDDKPEDLKVTNESGELAGTVNEVNTKGSITFTVTQSGVYTILSSAPKESGKAEERMAAAQPAIKPETPAKPADINGIPVVVIPAFLILGSISVIVFLHYKRKKD